jgi:CheY-like chemotaxis protein
MEQFNTAKHLILYADDDYEDVELLQQGLSPYTAIDLETFSNGRMLLSRISQLTPKDPLPCLVILDIYMPLLNGWETLQRLRKIECLNTVPILLLTTSEMECDRLGTRNYNAHIVVKPSATAERESLVDKIIAYCPEEVQQQIRSVSS